MIDEYLNKIDSLNEVYVGKIPEIQAIENAIHNARQKYIKFPINITKNTYKDKDLDKIQEAIEKAFGFYSVSFIVDYLPIENAYTIPICYNIDMAPEDHIIPYKGGYRYDNKLKYCTQIFVTTSVFCDSKYTDAEITGAVLHEIGHNFIITKRMRNPYRSFRDAYELMKKNTGLMKLLTLLPKWWYEQTYSLDGKENTNKQWQIIRNNPLISPVYDIFHKFFALLNEFISISIDFISEVNGQITILKIASASAYILNTTLGFQQTEELTQKRAMEYLSDSFANIYGYGPECISFIKKIELSKKRIDPGAYMPHIILIRKIIELPYLISVFAYDAHPTTALRLTKLIEDLKYESSKSNLSSKTKKELQEQIKKLEDIKDEMIREADNLPLIDRKRYIKLLYKRTLDEKRTQREQEYVSPKEIDKYYADMLKKDR